MTISHSLAASRFDTAVTGHGSTETRRSPKYSSDSGSQSCAVEIDDQTDPRVRHSQVRDHLRDVDWLESFDTLDLHDDSLFDDQVRPMLANQFALV